MNWTFLRRRKEEPKAPNLYREVELGGQAQALLDSSAYQRAVIAIREGIHQKWAAAPIRDVEGQAALKLMLKVLDDLEAHIEQEAQTALLASHQIADEEQFKANQKRAA